MSRAQLGTAAASFALVGDPCRLAVVLLLMDRALSLAELSARVEEMPRVVAGHLLTLQRARVVRSLETQNNTTYTVCNGVIVEMVKVMAFHLHTLTDG